MRGALAKMAFYNYVLHFSRFLMPLVVMPYLSRKLGPGPYGLVFLATSFGLVLSLVVEFGFSLSATRELSKHRDDPDHVAVTVASVLSAKLILAATALIIGLAALTWVPRLNQNASYACAGIAYALLSGMSPMWYYQATEKMRVQSALEIGGQFSAIAFVFILVREPGDALTVPLLQCIGASISTSCGYVNLYREVSFTTLTFASGFHAIRRGWTLFLVRVSVMLFTSANVFLVGLLLPSTEVAFYGSAEKVFSAFAGLFAPLVQTVFPRTNYLLATAPEKAIRLAKLAFGIVVSTGFIAALGLLMSSPFIVNLMFGRGFEPAIAISQILALAVPSIAANNVLGTQCMVPLHMDKAFNTIVYSAAILTVSFAFLIVPTFGPSAMALIRVGTEYYITISISCYLWSQRRTIMTRVRPHEATGGTEAQIAT
jgi:PST family polysaccharide transporter